MCPDPRPENRLKTKPRPYHCFHCGKLCGGKCAQFVVCATIVTRARSWSAAGTLRTRQGLTFAASPRSTNHTSPRCISGICGLSGVEFKKEGFRAQYHLLI